MTGFELRLWRRGMGWPQERAAKEFGISLATYKRYEKASPPQVVDMAILALSFEGMVEDLSKLSKASIIARLQTVVWKKVKDSSDLIEAEK